MLKKTSKTLLLIASLSLALHAEEIPKAISATTVAPASSIAASHALFETMNMKSTYEGTIERITQMQIQQNPQLKVVESTIRDFFTKYMGWDALKDEMAILYSKNYSTKELEEINTFYQTPVGQKTVQIMPQLAAAGAQIGQSKLATHMGELKTMLDAKLKVINTSTETKTETK